MNSSNLNSLEEDLTVALESMEQLYNRALGLIEATLPHETTQQVSACLARIQPTLSQIEAREQTLAPLRQAWIDSGQRPGPTLKLKLTRQEPLLQQLIGRINSMEKQILEARQELLPKVDSVVKHQQMQRAYQQQAR